MKEYSRSGKSPGLINELGRLQVIEPAPKRFVRQLDDCLEQRAGHILADDGGGLEQTFLLRGKPVDARRQYHLDRGRDLDCLDRLRQPISAALPLKRLRLHQRPDRLLQEERDSRA